MTRCLLWSARCRFGKLWQYFRQERASNCRPIRCCCVRPKPWNTIVWRLKIIKKSLTLDDLGERPSQLTSLFQPSCGCSNNNPRWSVGPCTFQVRQADACSMSQTSSSSLSHQRFHTCWTSRRWSKPKLKRLIYFFKIKCYLDFRTRSTVPRNRSRARRSVSRRAQQMRTRLVLQSEMYDLRLIFF